MNQPYFIVVLAHSLHGRIKRVHIPYQFVYVVLALALFGAVSLFGFVSSYVRMTWKVASYNSLRQEVDTLRSRYKQLEQESRQTGQQLASLQLLATEVSVAYGLKRKLEGPSDISDEAHLIPTVSESLEEYNFLKSANFSRYARRSTPLARARMLPASWPVDGRLMSHFGRRADPFSGEGAFHTGVDISALKGTPIKATADGVVAHASHAGRYGKLVIIEHDSGYETYYAHLSQIEVITGQTVRRGEIVGRAGATGRATSSHLHYEVRRAGTPLNPYQYLNRQIMAQAHSDFVF
ncbi:MAG: M23 family metallopeptidase [Bryobacteraceae bacterium]